MADGPAYAQYVVTVDAGATVGDWIENTVTVEADGNSSVVDMALTEVVADDVSGPAFDYSKEASAAQVAAGDQITYTLTIENTGDVTGTVHVHDAIPSPTTYVMGSLDVSTGTVSYGSGAIDGEVTVAPGESETVAYVVDVPGGTSSGTSIDNVATLVYAGNFSRMPFSVDVVDSPVAGVPDLSASSKTVDTLAGAGAGDIITYTITVENQGGLAADVQLYDSIPYATSFVVGSLSASAGTADYDAATGQISYQHTLPPAGSETIEFAVQIDSGFGFDQRQLRNAAVLYDQAHTGGMAVLSPWTMMSSPRFDGSKTAVSDSPLVAGEGHITYTLELQNTGGLTATDVMIQDALVDHVTYVTSTPEADGMAPMMWDVGDLGPGDSVSIDLVVAVNGDAEAEVINNSFDAWASNLMTTTVDADPIQVAGAFLAGTKTAVADVPLEAGVAMITYTLEVNNTGELTATGLMVEDVLPSSVTYVTSTPEAMGTTSLMWDAGDLGPGDSFTADVVVSVNAGTQGMTISNSFDAWATNAETITVDADDLVVAWVDLQGAKMSEADDPLMAGMGAITYTLTVSNEGTLAASSVVVTDMLPSQVMVVSGTTSVDVGTYNWDGDVFSWTIPSLAAGADVSASFVVTVNAGTEGDVIGNMMYVDGMMIPDADPPEVFSDLTLAKLAMDLNGDDVYPDDVIEYQVWLTNTGTVTHYNVMISDTLPAQLSYEAASATCSVSATCGSAAGVVTASLPSLAVGEVFTLTFEAMVQSVPDPMQVCNTAYAWSDEQPNMLHAMACLDVDVAWTYVYMPLMLRQSP